MDIFDRIAAALKALASGAPATDPAVTAHLTAIDDHLSQLDGSETDEKTRLDTIEAGLGKIAAAVDPSSPAATSGGTSTPMGDGTSTTPSTPPASTLPPVAPPVGSDGSTAPAASDGTVAAQPAASDGTPAPGLPGDGVPSAPVDNGSGAPDGSAVAPSAASASPSGL